MEVETAQRHSRALKGPAHRMTSRTVSKAEWVRWLVKEQANYENVLRLVKVGVRRAANARVKPHPDVPQKDPAIRLKPHIDTRRPGWARQLSNGWHALRTKDTGVRCDIFVVRCAGKFVAFRTGLVVVHSDGSDGSQCVDSQAGPPDPFVFSH